MASPFLCLDWWFITHVVSFHSLAHHFLCFEWRFRLALTIETPLNKQFDLIFYTWEQNPKVAFIYRHAPRKPLSLQHTICLKSFSYKHFYKPQEVAVHSACERSGMPLPMIPSLTWLPYQPINTLGGMLVLKAPVTYSSRPSIASKGQSALDKVRIQQPTPIAFAAGI